MRNIFFINILLFICGQAFSQACPGIQGSSAICSPNLSVPAGKFSDYNQFACVKRGQYFEGVINFNVPSSVVIPGSNPPQVTTIEYIRFNTINNLPCGICWTSNKANNQFNGSEYGCIRVSGTSNDALGTYKLEMTMYAKRAGVTNEDGPVSAELANYKFYIMVIDPQATCPAIKDTASAALKIAATGCPLSIEESSTLVNALHILPNPVTNEATISFTAEKSGEQTLRVYNMVGREVLKRELAVKAGTNETTFHRGNLPQGIYFISIGERKNAMTKRFIIAD